MNGLIGLGAVVAMLLAAGAVLGLTQRAGFSFRWLLVAAGLVVLNDALVTRVWGLIPDMLPGDMNWQGKLTALAATLAIAALPAFGWRRCGLTLAHAPGSLRAVLPVIAIYCAFFTAVAFALPGGGDAEDLAFQLALPGLQEEPFYRGVLLLALDRALPARLRLFGVDWGWGAILSSCLFGLDHAFGYGADGFAFDPPTMAMTAIPSLVAIWLRLRTGSLLMPALVHNYGNTVFLLI